MLHTGLRGIVGLDVRTAKAAFFLFNRFSEMEENKTFLLSLFDESTVNLILDSMNEKQLKCFDKIVMSKAKFNSKQNAVNLFYAYEKCSVHNCVHIKILQQ